MTIKAADNFDLEGVQRFLSYDSALNSFVTQYYQHDGSEFHLVGTIRDGYLDTFSETEQREFQRRLQNFLDYRKGLGERL